MSSHSRWVGLGTWALGIALATSARAEEATPPDPAAPPTEAVVAAPEASAPEAEAAPAQKPSYETTVVGTTPVHAAKLAVDKIPANIQVATDKDLERLHSADLSDFMNAGLGSVHVNQAQSNLLQPDVQYRGFTASPLLGIAQGLVAYVDGVRLNETFGDTVNWDLLPPSAIAEINLIPGSNPVYGENTLGGALSIQTKTGWSHPGLRATATGGSYWRKSLELEAGGSTANFSYFLAGDLFGDNGWRNFSPTDVKRLYGNVGWRRNATSLDLSVNGAMTLMFGNGPAPTQLLQADRADVFTHPDHTSNQAISGILRGTHRLGDTVTLAANAYLRALWTNTFNADNSEYDECTAPANVGLLCRSAQGVEETILDLNGNTVPFDPANPFNALNNTTNTAQQSYGGAVQAVISPKVFDRDNQLVVGATYGGGSAQFSSQAELATLTVDRSTAGSGLYDEASLVGVHTQSHHYGVFLTDTLEVLPKLSLTISGRINRSTVQLNDQLGTALDGFHVFTRFNPAVGATFRPFTWLGMFASYSESSRAPTPVELTCADEGDPCRLPNSFLVDPPLNQVVARTVEAGARGRVAIQDGGLRYSAAAFRTTSDDDILFVSSGALASEGFFSNVGQTQRQGIELSLLGTSGTLASLANLPLMVSGQLHYTWLQATFLTGFTALSPNHPDADPSGHVLVPVGANIPGIPNHIFKGDVELRLGETASLDVDFLYNSGQFLRGDEANLLAPIAGYLVMDVSADWHANQHFGAFLKVSNLLDQRYETFGVLARAADVLGPSFNNPRFVGPGAPRTLWAGITARL